MRLIWRDLGGFGPNRGVVYKNVEKFHLTQNIRLSGLACGNTTGRQEDAFNILQRIVARREQRRLVETR